MKGTCFYIVEMYQNTTVCPLQMPTGWQGSYVCTAGSLDTFPSECDNKIKGEPAAPMPAEFASSITSLVQPLSIGPEVDLGFC